MFTVVESRPGMSRMVIRKKPCQTGKTTAETQIYFGMSRNEPNCSGWILHTVCFIMLNVTDRPTSTIYNLNVGDFEDDEKRVKHCSTVSIKEI